MLNHTKLFNIDYVDTSVEFLAEILLNSPMDNKLNVVVTPNVDHVVRIVKQDSLKELYNSANYCVNDSRVLQFLAKLFLNKNVSLVTGSDLTKHLITKCDLSFFKVAVIGSSPEQITMLKKCAGDSSLPDDICHFNPVMGVLNNEYAINETVEFIVKNEADLTFIAIGSPQQEIVAIEAARRLTKGSLLCVGASIDYLTGKEKRAPELIQKMCLEWLYRFLQSPRKRFRRYFINCPQIFYLLLKERFKKP